MPSQSDYDEVFTKDVEDSVIRNLHPHLSYLIDKPDDYLIEMIGEYPLTKRVALLPLRASIRGYIKSQNSNSATAVADNSKE